MDTLKEKTCFSSVIKLSPALGDWTMLKNIKPDLEEINISKVRESSFDTLPKNLFKYSLFLHYRFAEYLTTKLSNDLNIKIEIHSLETQQLLYKEFIETKTKPMIQNDLAIGNLGKINLLIEPSFADMIINRISGGKGESLTAVDHFSEIELEMLSLQMNEILPFFCKIWKNILKETDIKAEIMHGKFQPDQKISVRETYIYYTFRFIFGEKNLVTIIMGYPNYILRSLLTIKNKVLDPVNKRVILNKKTLEKIKINLLAVLGRTNLTMKELRNLQDGDIITLENKIEDPLELYLTKKIKYFVQPGISNNKLAVQLLYLKEDDKTDSGVSKSRIKKIKKSSNKSRFLKEIENTTEEIVPVNHDEKSNFESSVNIEESKNTSHDFEKEGNISSVLNEKEFVSETKLEENEEPNFEEVETPLETNAEDTIESDIDSDSEDDGLVEEEDVDAEDESSDDEEISSDPEEVEEKEPGFDSNNNDDFSWDDIEPIKK